MYGPRVFQTAVFILDLRVSEFLCSSFKSRDLVSSSSPVLLVLISADLQNHMSWELIFLVQVPGVRVLDVGPEPLAPQGVPLVCDIPPTCGSPCRCKSCLNCISAPPTCLSVVFSFYLQLQKTCQSFSCSQRELFYM